MNRERLRTTFCGRSLAKGRMDFKYLHVMDRQSLKSGVLTVTGILYWFLYFNPLNVFENHNLFRGFHVKQI